MNGNKFYVSPFRYSNLFGAKNFEHNVSQYCLKMVDQLDTKRIAVQKIT